MNLFLTVGEDQVIVRAMAVGDDTVGDLRRDIRPGGAFFGVPYDTLVAAGSGEHTLDELKSFAGARE